MKKNILQKRTSHIFSNEFSKNERDHENHSVMRDHLQRVLFRLNRNCLCQNVLSQKYRFMTVTDDTKIGVLSHILPPSPSGQAMVLYRLLNGLPPDSYCLISRKNYAAEAAEAKLQGKYYHLKPAYQLPVLNGTVFFAFIIFFNALLGIYVRAKQILKIVREEKCRMLIACTGDLYDLPSAYFVSRWTGIPLVAYIFDDYAYQWTGFYRTISRRIEPLVLRHAQAVIVPNEYMQSEYMKRHRKPSTVIHNPCDLSDLAALDSGGRFFDETEINIVYAGAIYHAHYDAFHNLITAIRHLGRNDVKVHIYTSQTESWIRRNGIDGAMVVYHPHINQSEVPKLLRQATILFLPLAFDSTIPEVIKTSAPGKTGEYLSVERPILVHAPHDCFLSWYFGENECGIVVDKNDPQRLAEELDRLISDKALQIKLSRRAREAAERDFSAERMQKKFFETLESIAG